ncbi:MAG: phosphoglycerate kinase [Nanoarchaeota archaeon]|nr:phosphoglycerate kinase [Nanoarchaeota archaeon]
MINLPSLDSEDLSDKKVFLRYDCDVRVSASGKIIDETRLITGFSTLEYLLENNCTVIIAGHLRRPEGWDEKFTLFPIAEWFAQQFSSEAKETKLGEFKGWEIKDGLFLLENLRFYKEEKENSLEFARRLAGLGEIYVNEAFGSSHRAHASIVVIPKILPHFAGFHFIKEVKVLESIISSPKRPLTIILGGAKMETKLPLVAKMHGIADHILIGGKITDIDRELIEKEKVKSEKAKIIIAELTQEGRDIDSASLKEFENIISRSGMIVWNGPMGYLEGGFEESTLSIARAIIGSNAYRIAGGGDTVAFINKYGLFDKFDFVSMGGGSMLEFLSGKSLPGIIALQN